MFIKWLEKVVAGQNLSEIEMEGTMRAIMGGQATDSQIAGMLVGLRMKGETIEEITGAAKVMREKAISINNCKNLSIDTCGTGGDGSNTFNISTTVAFVLAGAGLTVAKHGNRSVSSKSGSADVLEALGVNLSLSPLQVGECLQEVNMGFLFAPVHHKAMKFAIIARKELGLRTIFNILGPLTNPAAVNYQVLGVYHPSLVYPLANVLNNLGVKSAMVVNGNGKLDEFTIDGVNKVAYLHDDIVEELEVTPENVGLKCSDIKELIGGTPEVNKEIILDILKGKLGPKRDVVLFNSAAAFMVTGLVKTWERGIELAVDVIDSGKAYKKLEELINFTNSQEVSA